MSDPTIVTLEDYPNLKVDRAWLESSREMATRQAAEIPARYADAVVTETAVANWVRSLVDSAVTSQRQPGTLVGVSTGSSLLLLGPTGVGKTHQVYGALRALAVSGVRCSWRYATAADVYAQMRPRAGVDSEDVFAEYAKASLLVLDDLGAAKGSEWTEELNYRLINYRYDRMLPTLFTSNVRPSELGAQLGDRVSSRLVEMADRVAIKGDDRRRNRSK